MSTTAYLSTEQGLSLQAYQQASTDKKCMLEYLNEGGANIVYKILPANETTPLPQQIQNKLLRLRKDLPTLSTEDQLQAFSESFKHLFEPNEVVQYELIRLDPTLLFTLQRSLAELDRAPNRIKDNIAIRETHGLLVTDMTPGKGQELLHFKPKWLAQSRDAPHGSRRCRTCALRAMRAAAGHGRTATDAQAICPLALIDTTSAQHQVSINKLTNEARIRDFLSGSGQRLLQRLRDGQLKFDPGGILNSECNDGAIALNLCKAMTLRDCSFFVRTSDHGLEARLADFDLKNVRKMAQWRRVEMDLISGGWYTNSEDRPLWHLEEICALSAKPRSDEI